MKAVRVFDFKQIPLLTCGDGIILDVIPGFDDINVKAQFAGYKAGAVEVQSETPLTSFWFPRRDRFASCQLFCNMCQCLS